MQFVLLKANTNKKKHPKGLTVLFQGECVKRPASEPPLGNKLVNDFEGPELNHEYLRCQLVEQQLPLSSILLIAPSAPIRTERMLDKCMVRLSLK